MNFTLLVKSVTGIHELQSSFQVVVVIFSKPVILFHSRADYKEKNKKMIIFDIYHTTTHNYPTINLWNKTFLGYELLVARKSSVWYFVDYC